MTGNPIARVSVLSTGSVRIRPEHVGPTWKSAYLWLATSRRWTALLPINVFVIEHRDGVVLFDTGQDRASVTDPRYFPGWPTGVLYSRVAKFHISPEETLEHCLRVLGYGLSDVDTAVLSHLHQDHIGGLPQLGGSEIVVSQSEWDSLAKPFPEARGLLRSRIDLAGLRWRQIVHEPLGDPSLEPFTTGHDLFGDGSLVLLSTPGHTPGSMSLLVRRTDRPPLLLVGDLTYDADLLSAGLVPGLGNRDQMRSSVTAVNALRDRMSGLVVLAAHDPGAAGALAKAETPQTIPS